jgi:predicted RNA-binding Zn-ribbon protein involved in translation (DUF1610 family)
VKRSRVLYFHRETNTGKLRALEDLHTEYSKKAPTITVNPAYTSQMCPSCGYVSRENRRGIEFQCRSCGRISHADVVGAINLLGRSEDKQVGLDDRPVRVGGTSERAISRTSAEQFLGSAAC